MSQLVGFGASLLILLLYFLATLGVVVFLTLMLNKFLPGKEGTAKDRIIAENRERGAFDKYVLQR